MNDALDLERRVRSFKRARVGFLVAAVLLPAALYALFDRQARRLDALADHGRTTTATVTELTRQGSSTYTHYAYAVEGQTYSWSVGEEQAPHAPGTTLIVTYLPEDPSLSRPEPGASRAATEAASNRVFTKKAMLGAVLFIAINAAITELKLRALLKRGRAAVGAPIISAAWAGRVVGLLLVAVIVLVNLDDKVAAVQAKAFGAAPWGVPVTPLVMVVSFILFAPYIWVFEHVMKIAFRAQREGVRLGLEAIIRLPQQYPELERSRLIALLGLGYFVVIAGAWILFASSRGI